jgi:MFS family permease
MVQKVIHTLLRKRHFWRTVGFDELSELYASMLLRSLALSLIGLFVPIYLYQIGYSVRSILGFYALFFLVRIGIDLVVAHIVGRIGPKHSIAMSTLINIIFLTMLLTLKELAWPLAFLAVVNSFGNSLFFISFHTDFSKIKHTNHSGKEIGYMLILEKIGGIAGPLVGGMIATFADPKYTMILAITLFAASLVPLLLSKEPVKVHQHITFRGLALKRHTRHFISYACHNAENTISILLWAFFISLAVFSSGIYAKIGAITALSTAVSIVAAHVIGKKIDSGNVGKIFKGSVIANSMLHVARIFVATPLSAIVVNLINDPVTVGYRMPFIKKYYDFADSLPGYRIAFIAISESLSAISRTILWGAMYIATFFMSDLASIKFGFILAAIIGLGIALQPNKVNNHK